MYVCMNECARVHGRVRMHLGVFGACCHGFDLRHQTLTKMGSCSMGTPEAKDDDGRFRTRRTVCL